MSKMPEYDRGRRDGIRWAITWLHLRGETMNDPKAKAILDAAAFNMGGDTSIKVGKMRERAIKARCVLAE